MKDHTMLQLFAVDNNDVVRHIDEVKRGLACECRCPVCDGPVMAKQGDVKGWHFAHVSGTECQHAGETALHLAAKQLLINEKGLMVPQTIVTTSHQLPDGREGSATVTRPEMWLDLLDVKDEVSFGDVKPDIVGYLSDAIMFIEIAVSHFIDEQKAQKLGRAGVATLEIDLSNVARSDTDWDSLRNVVIESIEDKQWIIMLGQNSLESEARELAMNEALSKPMPVHQHPNGKPPEYRFVIGGRRLYVREYPFGLTVWFQYDESVKERVKVIAKSLGGTFRPQYKNWLFPPESKPYLMEQLAQHSEQEMETMH